MYSDKEWPHAVEVIGPDGKKFSLEPTKKEEPKALGAPNEGVASDISSSADKLTQPNGTVKDSLRTDSKGRRLSEDHIMR